MSESILQSFAPTKINFTESDQNIQWAHFGQTRMKSFFMVFTKKTILCSDCRDAQADLCVCWMHMSEGSIVLLCKVRIDNEKQNKHKTLYYL